MMISLHSYHPAVKFIPENNPVFSVLSQFIIGDWNMKKGQPFRPFSLFFFFTHSQSLSLPTRRSRRDPFASHVS
jgi:hypothetical protein